MTEKSDVLHATTVSIDGRGVLILGPSGSGKSALALQLIALGAGLVADDRTKVHLSQDRVIASAPETIRGLIEARGVGLIRVAAAAPTPVALVVDLARSEDARLPEPHAHQVLGQPLPCLHKVDSAHFPAAIWLYMQGNIKEPQ